MAVGAEDLSEERLAAAMPGRPLRAYPALLSTESAAMAWARSGAPAGAVVAAGHQGSPRGRAGVPWELDQERDLCFSLVLRPRLPPEREGWLYPVVASGVADAIGPDTAIAWPDEVRRAGRRAGAVAVSVGIGPASVEWAVATVSLLGPAAPRAEQIARVVEAVEAAGARPAGELVRDYAARCETVGRTVHVRVTGVGAGMGDVTGRAVGLREDGALVIEMADGRRAAVPPQFLWSLEDAP